MEDSKVEEKRKAFMKRKNHNYTFTKTSMTDLNINIASH
jgi:hypothetical protein